MTDRNLKDRLGDEVMGFIESRKTLQLSTIQQDGTPYASYAPFAVGDECLYVLLSEIAIHATNLLHNPKASVLIIEDEDSAKELFARKRVNYSMDAIHIDVDADGWKQGVDILAERHGEIIHGLSNKSDFNLFRLKPKGGRYVKGFGRAFTLAGDTLAGEEINHMRDGHKDRVA